MASNQRIQVNSPKGIQNPVFSQAMIHGGLVYVSGNIGFDYSTMTSVGVGVGDHTRQALANIRTVLEEAGSSLQNIVKANVYLTDMADYAAHNKAWCEIIGDPKPARTCVCVKELPFKTDVSTTSSGGGGGGGGGDALPAGEGYGAFKLTLS